MNGRVIAGAVLLLVVVVGGIFLLVGANEGGQTSLGPTGTSGARGAQGTTLLVGVG